MKRVPQLDGVRGVAIVLVVVWHYFVCAINTMHTPAAYAARALALSWSGVDLFFVLSGFLIVGILLDHRSAGNYFRVFYLRRVCRIFPLYFLLLALGMFALTFVPSTFPSHDWLLANPVPLWSYATFTQNIFMGMRGDFGASWLSVTWSLAVEEQFYLVIPLIIYCASRRALPGVLLVGLLAAPLLRWMCPGLLADVGAPWRADSLMAGAYLAVLVRSPVFPSVETRYCRAVLATFLVLLLGAGVLTVTPALFGVFNHFWLAALYAVFILVALIDAVPPLTRLLRSAPLMWLGRLAYGIYMFHQVVNGLLHGWFGNSSPMLRMPSDATTTTAAVGATLILASLSYRLFEKPILRFGYQLQYSPAAVPRP